MSLKWRRKDQPGAYGARNETHSFVIEKEGSRWHLQVFTLPTPDELARRIFFSYDVSPSGFARLVDAKVYAHTQFVAKQGA
jgi:hypothetical protein